MQRIWAIGHYQSSMPGMGKGPIAQQRPQTVAGWDSLLQELQYYCQSVPWLERTYPLSVVRSIYQAVKVHNPAKGKEPGTLPWLVVALTALDWCTWIQHKWATYLCDNWVRSHQSWSHHSTSVTRLWLLLQLLPSGPSGPPSPPSLLSHPTSCACPHLSPSPLSLPSWMSLESEECTPTFHPTLFFFFFFELGVYCLLPYWAQDMCTAD